MRNHLIWNTLPFFLLSFFLEVNPFDGEAITNLQISTAASTATIQVEVLDQSTSLPVGNVTVFLRESGEISTTDQTTDNQGRTTYSVAVGTYEIGLNGDSLLALGYAAVAAQQITVGMGEAKFVQFAIQQATAGFEGNLSFGGVPVTGVNVMQFDESGVWLTSTTTDPTGFYELPTLPGNYFLQPDGTALLERGRDTAPPPRKGRHA